MVCSISRFLVFAYVGTDLRLECWQAVRLQLRPAMVKTSLSCSPCSRVPLYIPCCTIDLQQVSCLRIAERGGVQPLRLCLAVSAGQTGRTSDVHMLAEVAPDLEEHTSGTRKLARSCPCRRSPWQTCGRRRAPANALARQCDMGCQQTVILNRSARNIRMPTHRHIEVCKQ